MLESPGLEASKTPRGFDPQTAEFLTSIGQCVPRPLSAEVVQRWVNDLSALRRNMKFLADPNKFGARFPTWRRVALGVYPFTADQTIEEFCKAGVGTVDPVRNLMSLCDFSMKTTEVAELVLVTPADLGFCGGGQYVEVVLAATQRELKVCPAEAPVRLLLADFMCSLPAGTFSFATELISYAAHNWILAIARGVDGNSLYARSIEIGCVLPADFPLIFIQPPRSEAKQS